MPRTFVFPWKMGSVSAKYLAQTIGVRRVYPDGKYKPRGSDILINWGNASQPNWYDAAVAAGTTIINHPDLVAAATNKLKAFEKMHSSVNIPEFTTDKGVVLGWIQKGEAVVCRKILNGHSAAGIQIITDEDGILTTEDIPDAPLYTVYRKKAAEYRVHVLMGDIIDVSQKKLRNGLDKKSIDYKIRNHKGGWVYARVDIEIPDKVRVEAVKAINALSLQFGAVDIGWNSHYQEATVYEVNTAPGLVGTTLYRYAKGFSDLTGRPLLMKEPEIADDNLEAFHLEEFKDNNL